MSQEQSGLEKRSGLEQPEIAKALEELELDDELEGVGTPKDSVDVAMAKGERAEISARVAARISQDQTQVKYASWALILATGWHFVMGVISLAEGTVRTSLGILGVLELLLAVVLLWAAWGGQKADRQVLRMGLFGLAGGALVSVLGGRFGGWGWMLWGGVWCGWGWGRWNGCWSIQSHKSRLIRKSSVIIIWCRSWCV